MLSICVFCGARGGDTDVYGTAAAELATSLATAGHRLVYGGGSTGIMGSLADGMLAAGGDVIGVITEQLAQPELMHFGVTDMRITADMHQRKATMHALSDVYIALPGGLGTMEEFFEAVTWAQLELHARPIAILNLNGLYDGLVELLDTMKQRGFLSPRCRSLVTVTSSVEELCGWLEGLSAALGSTDSQGG
ncbi:MAG: TIGR00730 family Rossman fold protein [Planctomycetaceae bacterium]